ncbi:hypothetical protein [Bradyrhizobium prioriisuperbiae]|uniref:hypothetical protein n=1 Tax=Bradyrhizobium prioriisuperbiae TaxID=2854389 RepID=UPI0028F0CE85|nr:hypothetical protein [Bradyrhizobium prioritasuperba]
MAQSRKSRDDDAVKTAQALRLVKAFTALDSQPVREALLTLAEALAAASEGRRQ